MQIKIDGKELKLDEDRRRTVDAYVSRRSQVDVVFL